MHRIRRILRSFTAGMVTAITAIIVAVAQATIIWRSVDDHVATTDGYAWISSLYAKDWLIGAADGRPNQQGIDRAPAQAVMQQVRLDDRMDSLTTREREVFDWMACGQNNHAIAEALTISKATVRTHVGSILDKLMLRDRTQVMIYALKRGLVQLEDLP